MQTQSDTQAMLTDAVTAMLKRHHSTLSLTEGRRAADHWARLVELGLTAAELPEDVGGLELPFADIVPVFRQFGRSLATTSLLENAIMGGWLVASCDAAACTALLPDVAEGRVRVVLAFDEPGAGGDIKHTRTQATPQEKGWRITGKKSVIFGAGQATHVLAPALIYGSADGLSAESELGLFLLPCGCEGVERIEFDLYDGSAAADIRLNGVVALDDDLVARGDRAAALIEVALDRGRAALCHEAVGLMEAVLEITLDYVKTRNQFGQAIGAFQTMQHRMADMFMELELARSAAQYATDAIVSASNAEARMQAVSAAMVTICNSAKIVGESAVQAHGGIAMTREYLAGHYFKRLTMIARYLGDAEDHLDRYIRLVAFNPTVAIREISGS